MHFKKKHNILGHFLKQIDAGGEMVEEISFVFSGSIITIDCTALLFSSKTLQLIEMEMKECRVPRGFIERGNKQYV